MENTSSLANSLSPIDLPPLTWTWKMSLLSLILTLIIISSLISNLFVLYTFTFNSRKSPSTYGVFNLALADFLVSILVLPFLAILQVTHTWYFGPTLCTAWIFIHFTLCAASILSTLFICIERFIGVSYPLHHTRILNSQRIIKCLVLVWILALIPSLIRVFILHEPVDDEVDGIIRPTCKTTHHLVNALIASVAVLYIPSLLMIILYSRIFCIASSHLRGIELGYINGPKGSKWKICVHSEPEEKTKNINHGINCKERKLSPVKRDAISIDMNHSPGISLSHLLKQIRLAKKLFVLVGVILITYIPYFTAILLQAIDVDLVREDVFRSLTWLRYFTSSVIPFIYAFAMPSFRIHFVTSGGSGNRIRISSNSKTTRLKSSGSSSGKNQSCSV